jgi:hypothetical protein
MIYQNFYPTGMSTSINNAVAAHLKSALNQEMRKVTPQIASATALGVQEQLSKDVHGKIVKADAQLKDAIQKLATNKIVAESIGTYQ